MTYKFRVPTPPLHEGNGIGLKFREFNFYPTSVAGAPHGDASPNPYGLSSSAGFSATGSDTTIDRNITASTTTYVYRGFFKPDQTSNSWQFRTRSNDGSWLWIDDNATGSTVSLNVSDAIVKNGGTHVATTVTSNNITLTQTSSPSADEQLYYAIALVGGNDPGGGSLRLEFRRDGGSWQMDGTGYYFHDDKYSDGFDPSS